jgi:transposase
MEETSLLFLPEGMRIEQIQITENGLVIAVIAATPTSCCPLCTEPSSSIHCHYRRTLRDTPCAGRRVQLLLTVRKFTCRNPYCERKVFAERLPTFVELWARTTIRFCQQITSIGLATCGKGGARLAARLGMHTTRPTILRRIMALPSAPASSVVYLGIDDFGATRSYKCSCKDSRKEDLTWSSASSAEPSLNQVRLGQCSRAHTGGDEPVREHCDC